MPVSVSSRISGSTVGERNAGVENIEDFGADFLEQISTQQHVLKKLSEQNRKDTWDSRFDFLLFLFTFSNGTPQIQMAVSICAEMTGGIFFLFLVVLNIIFIYPILVLELFFGSYTKFTFSQIWRMAPLFYGFGITYVFLYVGFLLTTALNTGHSVMYAYHAFKSPWQQCHNESSHKDEHPKFETECMNPPHHDHPLEHCVRFKFPSLSFNCSYHEKHVQFIALHYYWEKFCDPEIEKALFFRESFLSHMIVWAVTFFFLYKGRNFISKLVLASALFMLFNVLFLIYFLISSEASTTYAVLRNVFAFRKEKMEFKAFRRIFWYIMYKTPVGFPNIYMTSSAYYNFTNFKPTKYASLLIIFGDLYLMGFVILLNFIDLSLSNSYGITANSLFMLEERGILFATIPEYLSNTYMKMTLTILYFWILTLNLLSNHVNTVHICLLNVFDWIPRYKEFKIQVIFPFCVAMFLLGFPLYKKDIVYCVQNYFIFLLTTYGSGISYLLEVWIYVVFYGIPRINNDFLYAFGKFPPLLLRITWFFIPFFSIFCISVTTIFHSKADTFCSNSELVIDTYYGSLLSIILCGAIIKFIKAFTNNNVTSLITPTFLWGPPIKDNRMERKIKGNLLQHIQDHSALKLQVSSGSARFSTDKNKLFDDDSIMNIKVEEVIEENPYHRDFFDGG